MSQENLPTSLLNQQDVFKLQPIVKWAGGKEQELKYILPNIPDKFNNYYEPFVGGGSVFTAMQAEKYFINDKSDELIELYSCIKLKDKMFYATLDDISTNWSKLSAFVNSQSEVFFKLHSDFISADAGNELIFEHFDNFLFSKLTQFSDIHFSMFDFNTDRFVMEIRKNLLRKLRRMSEIQRKNGVFDLKGILNNIETALKSAFYMCIRHIYNDILNYNLGDGFRSAIFLFIRNYAYSGMFRYNSSGGFNVPYGGIGYNSKSFSKKIAYYHSNDLTNLLDKTQIDCLDFEDFFKKNKPQKNDFIFLDPPYDSEFSTYANNEFSKNDQERLADYLINQCEAKWMMVIKNTEFIFNLYSNSGLTIKSFEKKYLVSFMNRNDRDVQHLMITNY